MKPVTREYPTVAAALVAAKKADTPLRVRVGSDLYRAHPDGRVDELSAAARAMSGSRRRKGGGRPPVKRYCPKCGKMCASLTKALAHCVNKPGSPRQEG